MKKILFLFLFTLTLKASNTITKEFLQDKPRSYAKDFYISLYLKQNITPNDAIWALGQANRVNNKLFYLYAKALKHKETSEVVRCIKKPTKLLYNEKDTCIKLGLSLYKATMLDKKILNILISKLKPNYPQSAKNLEVINSNIPFIKLKNSSPATFFNVFNSVGNKYRALKFNHHISRKFLEKLKSNKYQFAKMIKNIVTNKNLRTLQESILYINPLDLSHKTQFLLAINAIKHNQNYLALKYLEHTYKSAFYQFDKNKVLYWQYQLKKDNKILEELSSSWNNDIYSIYAKEKLHISMNNLITNMDLNLNKSTLFNKEDPFSWTSVLDDIKDGINEEKYNKYKILFSNEKTKAHLAYIEEKYNKYKNTYLINPYKDIIKNYPIKRQILINAIAKQESRFIPTSISISYALGVMQIMPFLSKAIAKELKEPYNILEQLNAKTNIKYANHHLNFLEKRLNHILFVAYAYNGGIGFTKRKILKAGLFKKGKYEPYLSMELVPYDESKRYAKKVLVNYLLYNNTMNENNKLTLKQLLNSITNDY